MLLSSTEQKYVGVLFYPNVHYGTAHVVRQVHELLS